MTVTAAAADDGDEPVRASRVVAIAVHGRISLRHVEEPPADERRVTNGLQIVRRRRHRRIVRVIDARQFAAGAETFTPKITRERGQARERRNGRAAAPDEHLFDDARPGDRTQQFVLGTRQRLASCRTPQPFALRVGGRRVQRVAAAERAIRQKDLQAAAANRLIDVEAARHHRGLLDRVAHETMRDAQHRTRNGASGEPRGDHVGNVARSRGVARLPFEPALNGVCRFAGLRREEQGELANVGLGDLDRKRRHQSPIRTSARRRPPVSGR